MAESSASRQERQAGGTGSSTATPIPTPGAKEWGSPRGSWEDLARRSQAHSQFPRASASSVRMSSLTSHPCSHGDKPKAHENCALSPARAPPPPPLPLWVPRNRDGKEEVGGPSPKSWEDSM